MEEDNLPYISQSRRAALFSDNPGDFDSRIGNAGELNYFITYIIREYVQNHGEKYQTYNDIMGVLEGAKMELYRKSIAPYEDKKEKENGKVIVGVEGKY